MANPENLIPNAERTPEERRENARKAGQASGVARRKKKAMRQAAADLLNMNISGSNSEATKAIKRRLREFGYDPEEATFQDAMLVGVMLKALKGDVRASEFMRDTAGNNPALNVRREELKLKKAELEIKRKALLDDSKPDRDENNLFEAIQTVGEVDTDDLPEVE